MQGRARYQRVADDLRDAINRGDYTPEEALPTEQQLIERYGYSRPTIRQAIALLRTEGLIDVEQGRGTFIRGRRPVRRVTSDRYTKAADAGQSPFRTEAAAAGIAGRGEVLGVEIIAAQGDVALWLEVPDGTEAVLRRRLLFANDEPIQIYDGYMPRTLVAGTDLESPRLITEGTYKALASIGHPPHHCSEELTSRMPTAKEIDMLQLRPSIPVVRVIRITRDEPGQVLQALRIIAAADRNVFTYDNLPVRS
ncbi:MAG: GntR family transcriptional regulator [Pseudonocardiaceae bacterium]